jgi:hypothetical protein
MFADVRRVMALDVPVPQGQSGYDGWCKGNMFDR